MQNENIPELKIEPQDDGSLMLKQQNGFEDPDCIIIHRLHVRHLAEQLGLIGKIDPDAQRTIATLTRRLLLLQHRINHLDDWLRRFSDSDHADLSYEWAYSGGTAEMADEFCHGLDGDAEQQDAGPAKPTPTPATPATAQASLL